MTRRHCSPLLETAQKLDASAPRASGGRGVTIRLPLTSVSPGRYVLRVEASAADSDHTASREIPIEGLP